MIEQIERIIAVATERDKEYFRTYLYILKKTNIELTRKQKKQIQKAIDYHKKKYQI